MLRQVGRGASHAQAQALGAVLQAWTNLAQLWHAMIQSSAQQRKTTAEMLRPCAGAGDAESVI